MEIRIAKGDSRKFLMRIHDLFTGERLDLNDLTVYFTIKKKLSDGDEEILVEHNSDEAGITITNAFKGEAILQVTPTDTDLHPGDYYFDIRCVNAGGTEVISNYPNYGTFVVYEVVRQSFSV